MKTLSETWFAEGYIDFELKRYTLLAYLQEVKKYLQEKFPKQLTDINLEQLEVLYERMISDDELMEELENIINYSAKKMKLAITNGTEIYESVEVSLKIAPVGLIPLETNEGYMFLMNSLQQQTCVYYYRIT